MKLKKQAVARSFLLSHLKMNVNLERACSLFDLKKLKCQRGTLDIAKTDENHNFFSGEILSLGVSVLQSRVPTESGLYSLSNLYKEVRKNGKINSGVKSCTVSDHIVNRSLQLNH